MEGDQFKRNFIADTSRKIHPSSKVRVFDQSSHIRLASIGRVYCSQPHRQKQCMVYLDCIFFLCLGDLRDLSWRECSLFHLLLHGGSCMQSHTQRQTRKEERVTQEDNYAAFLCYWGRGKGKLQFSWQSARLALQSVVGSNPTQGISFYFTCLLCLPTSQLPHSLPSYLRSFTTRVCTEYAGLSDWIEHPTSLPSSPSPLAVFPTPSLLPPPLVRTHVSPGRCTHPHIQHSSPQKLPLTVLTQYYYKQTTFLASERQQFIASRVYLESHFLTKKLAQIFNFPYKTFPPATVYTSEQLISPSFPNKVQLPYFFAHSSILKIS